jgi:hypothetical protein
VAKYCRLAGDLVATQRICSRFATATVIYIAILQHIRVMALMWFELMFLRLLIDQWF